MNAMNPSIELERLYESGIQFTVQPDLGGGFRVGHGDYLRRVENTAVLPTVEQAIGWLRAEVVIRYPDSDYAKRLLAS